jgi:hypothetical protein
LLAHFVVGLGVWWSFSSQAQLCEIDITELYRTDTATTFKIKGTARLPRYNPESYAYIANDVVIQLQCLTDNTGTWPSFYDRWDSAARCFANRQGCISDEKLRGHHLRSATLFRHTFTPDEAGLLIPFETTFYVPPEVNESRIVMQFARAVDAPPWDGLQQTYTWQELGSWPKSIPVNIRREATAEVPAPKPKPEPPPAANSSAVTFLSAQVSASELVLDLQFPQTSAGKLLAASISTVEEGKPFQQVRFFVKDSGKASLSFRSKPIGWEPMNHRIEVMQDGKSIGARVINFENLNKTGPTKLAF